MKRILLGLWCVGLSVGCGDGGSGASDSGENTNTGGDGGSDDGRGGTGAMGGEGVGGDSDGSGGGPDGSGGESGGSGGASTGAPSASFSFDIDDVLVGEEVELDGSSSTGTGELTFVWTLVGPQGSSAELSDPAVAGPVFTPDLPGTYSVTLTVRDEEGAETSTTHEIVVYGLDRYIAGSVRDDSLEYYPVYWKNEEPVLLEGAPAGVRAVDIFVTDADVWVAGADSGKAVGYWRNGVWTSLSTGSSDITDMGQGPQGLVLSGRRAGQAGLWIDGDWNAVSSTSSIVGYTFFDANEHLFDNTQRYWVNGEEVELERLDPGDSLQLYSIEVGAEGSLIAGEYYGSGESFPAVWIGGGISPLETDGNGGAAWGVAQDGDDIWASGYVYDGSGYYQPHVWKNGAPTALGTLSPDEDYYVYRLTARRGKFTAVGRGADSFAYQKPLLWTSGEATPSVLPGPAGVVAQTGEARAIFAHRTLAPSLAVGPANLQAIGSRGNIALSWGAVDGASGYHVYRGTDGVDFSRITSDALSTTSLDDPMSSPADDGVEYFYRVTSIVDGVESSPSVAVMEVHGTRVGSGTRSGDFLPSDSPYVLDEGTDLVLTGSATVHAGAHLTVQAGSTMSIGGGGFAINGGLRMKGTAGSPVVLNASEAFDVVNNSDRPWDPSSEEGVSFEYVVLDGLDDLWVHQSMRLSHVRTIPVSAGDSRLWLFSSMGDDSEITRCTFDATEVRVHDDFSQGEFLLASSEFTALRFHVTPDKGLPLVASGGIIDNVIDASELILFNFSSDSSVVLPLGGNYWPNAVAPPDPGYSVAPATTAGADFDDPVGSWTSAPAVYGADISGY